jgi:hypothetical protein
LGRGAFGRRRILRHLCHHIDPVAGAPATTPASRIRPTRFSRWLAPAASLAPFPRVCPPGGDRLARGLEPRRSPPRSQSTLRLDLIRCGPDSMNACVIFGPMRYIVSSGVASCYPTRAGVPHMRCVRLGSCQSSCTQYGNTHHDAQHHSKRRVARKPLRTHAVFRLSMAPLRHYHHKF